MTTIIATTKDEALMFNVKSYVNKVYADAVTITVNDELYTINIQADTAYTNNVRLMVNAYIAGYIDHS